MWLMLAIALAFQLPALKVTDPWGLPVPNVTVNFSGVTATTDDNGVVRIPDGTGPIDISIEVPGFQPYRQTLPRWTGEQIVQLNVASIRDRVTVTATRDERLGADAAASVTVLDAETIRTSPSRAIDDMLRQVPGFSLLRRTSSVAAHPTSQGVSLRGVGASGASRTLVLVDGVPLNDPFGSWVYWNRVPRLSIDTIEVVRGGASDLYGSSALGGVVHLRRRRPQPMTVLGEVSFGQREQIQGSVYFSDVRNGWGYGITADAFTTDGYIPVSEAERGTVDVAVASTYRTGNIFLERTWGPAFRLFSDFVVSTEDRKNGTTLTRNDTNYRQGVLGFEWSHPRGRTEYRVYGGSEAFDSSFSSIQRNRTLETLTSDQRVPLGYGGLEGHTLLSIGRHNVVAGFGYRHASGVSNEIQYRTGGPVFLRNGGNQTVVSVFLEDIINVLPRVTVSGSARWDQWHNEELTGRKADRNRISPKVSITGRVSPNLSLHGAGYGAFRAPTLNELYRPFSVGNTLTQANPDLGPEILKGGDAGVQFKAFGGRAHTRVSAYWSEISGTVGNITLVQTVQQIVRQRRNLGAARARGIEVEAELMPFREWSIVASYLLSDSTVISYPSQTALEGLWLPQVPRHQFSINSQTTYRGFRGTLQARTTGRQFDDDRNTLALERYFNLDAAVARPVAPGIEVFVAGENLTDAQIQVNKTPVTSYAAPRTVRFGLSFRLGEK